MSAIDRLIEGSIDIHVHFGPDARVERRADALQVARAAHAMGMRGIVLKAHEYTTAPLAYLVGQQVSGLAVMGGLCLDVEVGGLNPMALEATANLGGKVIWMPTFSAQSDRKRQGLEGGIVILDDKGRLVPELYTILDAIKRHDLVLATGHLSPKESLALVQEARHLGLNRIVVTHASHIHHWMGMTVEDMVALARMGALIEHCVGVMMPLNQRMTPQALAEMIRAVGAENCVLSTDFGQAHHPIAPEGFRMGIATLLRAGMDEVDLGLMVKDNPARLLGL
ncbi:MAG: DUF6282 family protein [Chloroflexota bacterium]|nr:DUF6282 family protein [Chloroflexota bacterium]